MRVAVDVTPLAGARTGIGNFVRALTHGLADRSGIEPVGLAMTARGRAAIGAELGPETTLGRPAAARPLRWLWQRVDWPPVELFTGPLDLVHGTNYVVPPGRRCRELVSVHDLSAWKHPDDVHPTSRAYPGLVARAIARGADVHAISHVVGTEIVGTLGIDADRVHVVHLAADPLPPGDRTRASEVADGPYVLAIGTIEPRKDYPGLVEAMRRLPPGSSDVSLVIAGGEGWGSAALDEAVARSGMDDRVIRLGYVTDQQKADLLAGASLVVCSSTDEGFGIVPLEAMAAGVPIVATAAGSLPEVCGDAAELVPVADPDALADALHRVLADDELRTRLIDRGHRRAGTFTWNRTVDGLCEVYRAINAR